MDIKQEKSPPEPKKRTKLTAIKQGMLYFALYLAGILSFLIIIFEPFTMSTYFSDNSLLPGLVNREFSLETEAEYYLKHIEKMSKITDRESTMQAILNFIKVEMDNFGLAAYEQKFTYQRDGVQLNATNIYSIIRAERSTSSEAILLGASLKFESLPSVAMALSLTKYFSSKSYWAKDLIILFIDGQESGAAAWLESYHDINFRKFKHSSTDLEERSGPIQAAIMLELFGRKVSRVNVKIHGNYGQLPNLDLFNLVVEMAARESITPYFHNKSLPFNLDNNELYRHHLDTAISFVTTQATMKSDGLHGHFLQYAIQSLTIQGPEATSKNLMMASFLNIGRLIEGTFRSLNNLTERFNRSYYFYIILSLRRFTSIAYYMSSFGLMVAPLILKARIIASEQQVGLRVVILLISAWALTMISLINISSAFLLALVITPVLIMV